ncbi:MAG: hypothetical protein PVF45_00270, partial [Anaerolineae bacterium]
MSNTQMTVKDDGIRTAIKALQRIHAARRAEAVAWRELAAAMQQVRAYRPPGLGALGEVLLAGADQGSDFGDEGAGSGGGFDGGALDPDGAGANVLSDLDLPPELSFPVEGEEEMGDDPWSEVLAEEDASLARTSLQ